MCQSVVFLNICWVCLTLFSNIVFAGIFTMTDLAGQLYTINSVKVHFPCKAYPSQLSMMDKVTICYLLCTYDDTKGKNK